MTKNIFIIAFLITSTLFAQNTLSRIHVKGNNFVDDKGNTVVFRGLNTSDPHKLDNQGYWTLEYFKEMKNWGANLVRFPIHPPNWRERGHDAYFELLDKGIKWAEELGMHVIIDWHSIGNLRTEMYQSDIYDTTQKETFDFWRKLLLGMVTTQLLPFMKFLMSLQLITIHLGQLIGNNGLISIKK